MQPILKPGARAYHEPTRSFFTVDRIEGRKVWPKGGTVYYAAKYCRGVCQ